MTMPSITQWNRVVYFTEKERAAAQHNTRQKYESRLNFFPSWDDFVKRGT
jgi:hypothetical protein